jgi:hypothetical protein
MKLGLDALSAAKPQLAKTVKQTRKIKDFRMKLAIITPFHKNQLNT